LGTVGASCKALCLVLYTYSLPPALASLVSLSAPPRMCMFCECVGMLLVPAAGFLCGCVFCFLVDQHVHSQHCPGSYPRSTMLHSVQADRLLGVRASARSSQTLPCVEGGQVLRGDKGTSLVCSVYCMAPIVACRVSGACFMWKVMLFCRATRRCGTLQTLSEAAGAWHLSVL
jgi:hypothetical protein